MPSKRGSGSGSRNSGPAQTRSLDEESEMEGYGDLREKEETLKTSMAIDVGLRKGQRQRRLENQFDSQARELEDQVDERTEEYQQETKRVRDAFVTKLLALTQRKAHIEDQIIKHVQELADAYEVVKGEFQAVLKGRSEEFREAINTMHELEGEGNASPNRQH